jgi:protein-L-isoaspartate(D-aspartate) O-methyltransferase
MVETQIVGREIENRQVIKAMFEVPRHLFVPNYLQSEAYNDYPLPIGEAQTISQPYMVAKMVALLEPQEDSRILEIGTGSAYQAAVLAEIVQQVFTVEWIDGLAKKAESLTKRLRYDNISIKTGDGSVGWPEHAPYNGIVISAAAPELPAPLVEQLGEGGMIVAPVGNRVIQSLTRAKKISGKLQREQLFDCMFVPLLGAHGWNN